MFSKKIFLLLPSALLIFVFVSIYNSFFWNEFGGISTFLWTLNSDWMMHMSQVQAFSSHSFLHVLFHNPLYAGEVLTYPFFVNWLSGILLWASGNIVFSMTAPMYLGAAFFMASFIYLTYTLTKSYFVASVAPVLFFFLAGFQYLEIFPLFQNDTWASLPDWELNGNILEPAGYNWKSFFLTTFLPQRSYIWGMAVGCLALVFFLRSGQFFNISSISHKKKNISGSFLNNLKNPFVIGLLIGTLSFVHTHTFFYFFFLFFGLTVWNSISMFIKKGYKKAWKIFQSFLVLGLGTCLTSAPFLYILSLKSGRSIWEEFTFFPLSKAGYEQYFESVLFLPEIIQNIGHIFVYWTWNWGIFFLLALVLCIPKIFNAVTLSFSPLNKTFLWRFYIINTGILFLFSIVQTQNNPWDNTKLHLWSALFITIGVSVYLRYLWKKNIILKITSLILFFFMTLSGVLLVWSGINDDHIPVFSRTELQRAKNISSIISPDSVVLTSDYFHHWFSPLVPNQIFMGYRGWMGSYGLEYGPRVRIAQDIYAGKNNTSALLRAYNIDYVVVDNSAQSEFRTKWNREYFEQNFLKIYSENDITLWDVRSYKTSK